MSGMKLDERDGPFDLKPSEVIGIVERAGVHISREQASAFSGWAYSTFKNWEKDAILKAKEDEREECAKDISAMDVPVPRSNSWQLGFMRARKSAVEAIRSRSKPTQC